MQQILAALDIKDPASRKRALVAAIASAVALGINPFLTSKGLPPVGAVELGVFGGIVATYLGQSGAVAIAEAKAAGAAAAGAVTTPAQAAAVLGSEPTP